MMKKQLALLLAIGMLATAIGFSACDGGSESASSGNKNSGTPTTSDSTPSESDSESTAQHEHSPVYYAGVAADCIHDGKAAYWYCDGCGKYYSDEACTTELTEFTVPSLGGHDTTNGTCGVCGWSVWDGTSKATAFSGGEGTEEAPYTIGSAAELAYLAASVNAGESYADKHLKLTVDIDLSGKVWTQIGYYVEEAKNHSEEKPFSGIFDGDEHTIYNLTSETAAGRFGMFGLVRSATVKNLKFANVNVDAKSGTLNKEYHRGASALIAMSVGSVTVDNVQLLSGSISGQSYTGGIIAHAVGSSTELVGTEEVKISNCVSYLEIANAGNFCGAILGGTFGKLVAIKTTIENCTNYGTVHGNTYTGGIVGLIRNSDAVPATAMTVKNCYDYGNVLGGKYVGGIVGWNRTMITNCWVYDGITLGTKTLRELCITGEGDMLDITLVGYADSYIGAVTGEDNAGGKTDFTNCGLCDPEGRPTAEWEAYKLTENYQWAIS